MSKEINDWVGMFMPTYFDDQGVICKDIKAGKKNPYRSFLDLLCKKVDLFVSHPEFPYMFIAVGRTNDNSFKAINQRRIKKGFSFRDILNRSLDQIAKDAKVVSNLEDLHTHFRSLKDLDTIFSKAQKEKSQILASDEDILFLWDLFEKEFDQYK